MQNSLKILIPTDTAFLENITVSGSLLEECYAAIGEIYYFVKFPPHCHYLEVMDLLRNNGQQLTGLQNSY